jgi:hypothetical protein
MATKVPAAAKRGDTETSALGSSLDILTAVCRMLAARCLWAFMLVPLFTGDVVFPDRVGTRADLGLVRVLAAI